MNLVFEDAPLFRKFIEGISVLVDEAEFVISEKGLALKATDPSQISLIDFEVPKKAFKKFDVAEPTRIGLDLSYLSQVMGRAKSGDSLEWILGSDKSQLLIVFTGKAKRSFSVPLLDITTGDLPLPKIDFDAEIKIKAEVLGDSLKDASLISTHVVFAIEDDSFVVRANSSKGNLKNVYTQKDDAVISLKAKDEVKSMFPLDYLVNIIKAASGDTEVKVGLKSNAPVEVTYTIGEAKFQYFLAPRIESE